MTDNTVKVTYADGSSEEVPYALLPSVRLRIEEERGKPISQVYEEDEADGGVPVSFYQCVHGWFQLRRGEERPFREWLDAIDAIEWTGKIAEAIEAKAAADRGEDPLPMSDWFSESAEPQTLEANQSLT